MRVQTLNQFCCRGRGIPYAVNLCRVIWMLRQSVLIALLPLALEVFRHVNPDKDNVVITFFKGILGGLKFSLPIIRINKRHPVGILPVENKRLVDFANPFIVGLSHAGDNITITIPRINGVLRHELKGVLVLI